MPHINYEIAVLTKDIDIFSGYIKRLENPDPVLLAKGMGRGLKLYDEVARDAHAAAVLDTFCLSLAGKETEILPASDSDFDKIISEFTADTILGTNFSQLISEMAKFILYGFSVAEVMWAIRDNSLVVDKFITKHSRRFIFDFERRLKLITLENMIEGEELPDRKFIVFTYGDSDNPYGFGLGQILWFPVWFKKHGIKFWMTFLDKFGGPTTIGKYPNNATEADKQVLEDATRVIHQESGIIIPEGMVIELLEAARNGTVSYREMCEYMDIQMSKAVLGHNLTTEVSGGSYAASKTANNILDLRIKAVADIMSEKLNASVIKWLVDYNFPGVKKYPTLWFKLDSAPDLQAMAVRDKILAVDIGVKIDEQYFYDAYNLPRPNEGDAYIGGVVAPTLPQNKQPESMAEFADKKNKTDDPVLDVWDIKNGVSDAVIDKMLEPVISKIMTASNWTEVGESIYTLYPDLDSSTFQEMLARAMFGAGLKGSADITDGK